MNRARRRLTSVIEQISMRDEKLFPLANLLQQAMSVFLKNCGLAPWLLLLFVVVYILTMINNTLSDKVYYIIFTNLKLCLATATHNFKWVKITHIGVI